MTPGRNYTKLFLLLLVAILILLGMATFGFSYLSYALLKSRADALVSDGSANRFTPQLYEKIRVALRYAGLALIVAGALCYFIRRRVERFIHDLLASTRSLSREAREHLRETLRKENPGHLFALLFILLLTVSIRLFFLSVPVRGDEGGTFLRYASRPLLIALSDYTPNNHLFHTFLAHISYLLFGASPWAIRMPALVAGILLVPATYVAARTLYDRDAALLAAGLVASSSALIEYSTNARGYTLICLFFIWTLALAVYLLRHRSLAAWLLWAVLSALGFYTVPVMLYPFGIVVIWLFLSIALQTGARERIHQIKYLAIFSTVAVFLTCLLYVPVFAVSGLKAIVANEYIKPLPLSSFIAFFPSSLPSVWQQWNRDIPALVRFLLVIGFCASLFAHKRLTEYRVPVILAVVLWLPPVLVMQRVVPFVRVWLFLLPLYLIMASAGVVYLLRLVYAKIGRGMTAMLLISVVALSVWLSVLVARSPSVANSEDSLRDAEAITVFLKGYLKPGDRVLATADSLGSLHYYFYKYDLPFSYLNSDPQESRRILVVLKEPEQSIDQTNMVVAVGQEVRATDYGTPRMLQRFNFASLYEMVR